MIFYDECNTIIGCLRFVFKDDSLLEKVLLNDDRWHALITKHKIKRNHEIGNPICQQFQEYIHGDRKQIDVPFELTVTPFQKQTWAALISITYGEIRSYCEIATFIGKAKAYRTVAQSNAITSRTRLNPSYLAIAKYKI